MLPWRESRCVTQTSSIVFITSYLNMKCCNRGNIAQRAVDSVLGDANVCFADEQHDREHMIRVIASPNPSAGLRNGCQQVKPGGIGVADVRGSIASFTGENKFCKHAERVPYITRTVHGLVPAA